MVKDSSSPGISNSTQERIKSVFENALEARDVLVTLGEDPRLTGGNLQDVQEKLDVIKDSIDLILSNA